RIWVSDGVKETGVRISQPRTGSIVGHRPWKLLDGKTPRISSLSVRWVSRRESAWIAVTCVTDGRQTTPGRTCPSGAFGPVHRLRLLCAALRAALPRTSQQLLADDGLLAARPDGNERNRHTDQPLQARDVVLSCLGQLFEARAPCDVLMPS